ncbi:MAG: hydrogenase expression/formation protein HypE [Capsulimonadaceae bacterium]
MHPSPEHSQPASVIDLEHLVCPIPKTEYPQILMAHGGGGRLMHQLINKIFAKAFRLPEDGERHDSAVVDLGKHAGRVAMTTDSFVVHPLFFPGGDIGSLAVNGTVNDLAMSGARPVALMCGFILEEGLPMEMLWRIACSMSSAALNAGVSIVTGDTKVVDRGKGDGVYINTSGVGVFDHARRIAPSAVCSGDAVLLSGDIGRHGVAIMAQREGLEFETTIQSDCAPLTGAVRRLLDAGIEVHCLRDLTRGGLASGLVEISSAAQIEIRIDETLIPVHEQVSAACEMLGLDPLYVANEGCFVAFVAAGHADRAIDLLRTEPHCHAACRIGSVGRYGRPDVILRSRIGADRIVDYITGEQLPRIC